MTEQLANFGETTLAEALDASETIVTVTAGGVFPAVGDFRVNCEDELMLVSARTGADLTVTRGAEGTTAATHANGAAITMVLTAAGLDTAIDERVAAHTGDTSAAHAASEIAFTPNGSIAATDVQAAIQEVRDEAVGGGAMGVPVVIVYGTAGSPNTWTKPAGLVALLVEVIGGGGGSGGCAATIAGQGASSGGGGGGGYARKMFAGAALPATCTATVGDGGAGGAAGNNNGVAGTASTFAGTGITTVLGNAGGPGSGSAASGGDSSPIGGGAGGTATGGDINVTGGDGTLAAVMNGKTVMTSNGGGTVLGGVQRAGNGATIAGQAYGGGAGGARIGASASAIAGAAGAEGVIIVTEYY